MINFWILVTLLFNLLRYGSGLNNTVFDQCIQMQFDIDIFQSLFKCNLIWI